MSETSPKMSYDKHNGVSISVTTRIYLSKDMVNKNSLIFKMIFLDVLKRFE